MTVATSVASVPALLPGQQSTAPSWVDHLRALTTPSWRTGEWDERQALFLPDPDNPETRLYRCGRQGCLVNVPVKGSTCVSCRKEQRANSWSDAELRSHPREHVVVRSHLRAGDCTVADGTRQCAREVVANGLCDPHYHQIPAARAPLPRLGECAVRICGHEVQHERSSLCRPHRLAMARLAKKLNRSLSEAEYARDQAEPFVPAHALPLAVLPDPLRSELRFGMESFDRTRNLPWDAAGWRAVFNTLRRQRPATLVGHDPKDLPEWIGEHGATGHIWRHLFTSLNAEHRQYSGVSLDPDLLDPHALGLTYKAKRPNKSLPARQRQIDLRPVVQPWLREAARHFIIVTKPNMEVVRRIEKVAVTASHALRDTRADEGMVAAALTAGDMKSIVTAINRANRARKTQEGHLAEWWKIVEHARNHGLWEDIRDEFRRDVRDHKPDAAASASDEEEGKGRPLPLSVVQHITEYLPLVGSNLSQRQHAGRDGEARTRIYLTMLTVLRDTGRRPGEVVSLTDDCLRRDDDGMWYLSYANHKGRRKDRRLPIQTPTADTLNEWRDYRNEVEGPSKWMFPSPINRGSHVSTGMLEDALESWIAVTPEITGTVEDLDGVFVPFDLKTINLYDFRHTYAQRHADAGIEPDDLRALMDHRSIRTTMGYYEVGWKRRKNAAKKVQPFTVDRTGRPVRLSEGAVRLAEVAVPYGLCREPSNVQAGGTACPIRFQCSGCEFYAVDPSFKPDLERHVFELRKNLAAARAMGAPSYVVQNFEGQIAAYEALLAKMTEALAALPEADRAEIENITALLRNGRLAAEQRRALPLTVIHRNPGTST